MEEKELIRKMEKIEFSDFQMPGYQRQLRRMLMVAGQQKKAGFCEAAIAKLRKGVGMFGRAFRSPVFKPALATLTILALVLALVPVLNNPAQVSASDIALADPQVRASFTPDELAHLDIQEVDATNGQKVVLLSCDAGMVAVGIDIAAKKVSNWLYDTLSIPKVTVPATKYQLIFVSLPNGIADLYIAGSDGSNALRITDSSSYNDLFRYYLDWSDESGKLAFISRRDSDEIEPDYEAHRSQVYTMNVDGSDITKLTWLHAAIWPAWSPDGSKIAFTGSMIVTFNPDGTFKDPPDQQIYVMNADGSNLTRLTENHIPGFAGSCYNQLPQWSPDGQQIAFGTNVDRNGEIYVMNADGSNLTNLTNDLAKDFAPIWSPDGTKIAFMSERGGVTSIYVMNSDGSGVYKLTLDNTEETNPAWSPDGRKIVFCSGKSGGRDLFTINTDGTGLTRLTLSVSQYTLEAKWSPDGQQIAYYDSASNLCVMNTDGSNSKIIAEKVANFFWAALSSYPISLVPQDSPDNVTTSPQGVNPDNWPVTKDKAFELAKKYVPADIVARSKISIIPTPDKTSNDSIGHWGVFLENISVTKSDLGWDKYIVQNTKYNPSLPSVSFKSDGPYTRLIVFIDGVDGGLKYLSAWPKLS